MIIIFILLVLLIIYLRTIEHFDVDKKYITYISSVNEGLSHQKSNLMTAIKDSYYLGKILIIPQFNLAGHHNNGKNIKDNLSKYYDYTKLKINGKKYDVKFDKNNINKADIETVNISNQLFRKDPKIKTSNKKLDITLPYNKDILNIATKICSQLGRFICIHVRRGDMLKLKSNLDMDTGVDNIMSKIEKYKSKFDNIYIMTNESNLSMYNKIKNVYKNKIFFYTNFPELKKIEDNYYLFCIENCIMEKANVRISTFKTDNNYYDDYLSHNKGWQ